MDFSNPKTIAELAKALNKGCFGDVNQTITGLNEIHRIKTGELVFVDQLIDGSEIEFDTIKSKILIHKM